MDIGTNLAVDIYQPIFSRSAKPYSLEISGVSILLAPRIPSNSDQLKVQSVDKQDNYISVSG